MISLLRTLILAAAFVLAASAAGLSPAAAQEELGLRDARAQGLVGETARGYVAPVKAPTPDVTALVNRINSARRTKYEQIARQNGTQLTDVEILAAQKIIERVPSGTFVQGTGGGWTRK